MAILNPHINFNSNAAEAFNFYQSVFGGTFEKIIRFKDIASPEMSFDPKEENNLMNIALPIGKYNKLIGNDVPSFLGKVNEQENRSKISVSTDSKAEADKLFNGLSAGGSVEVPMTDSPWGAYFGMFRDKYGIEWIIAYDTTSNSTS